MLFSISALMRGYRVLYFGADLPLDQIPMLVQRSGVRGVVLASREKVNKTMETRLADLVPAIDVPVLLGGPAGDEAIPLFEAAGGVRLGSRISIALRVLRSQVPVYVGAARGRRKPTRDR